MYNRSINHSWSVNRSNLEDAVFDILICSKAKVFCGTPNRNEQSVQSSYSNFIYGLRGVYDIYIYIYIIKWIKDCSAFGQEIIK